MSKNKLIISIFLLSILSSFLVNAFGVTLPYYPENGYGEITSEPGQVSEVMFNLQNGESEDLKIRATINEGKDIAQIKGTIDFNVPKNTKDILVPVTLTIPKNAVTGDKFLVTIEFSQVVDSASGTSLSTAIGQKFYVKIYKPSLGEKINRIIPFETKDIIGYLIVIVLILVIITLIRRNLSKKNS